MGGRQVAPGPLFCQTSCDGGPNSAAEQLTGWETDARRGEGAQPGGGVRGGYCTGKLPHAAGPARRACRSAFVCCTRRARAPVQLPVGAGNKRQGQCMPRRRFAPLPHDGGVGSGVEAEGGAWLAASGHAQAAAPRNRLGHPAVRSAAARAWQLAKARARWVQGPGRRRWRSMAMGMGVPVSLGVVGVAVPRPARGAAAAPGCARCGSCGRGMCAAAVVRRDGSAAARAAVAAAAAACFAPAARAAPAGGDVGARRSRAAGAAGVALGLEPQAAEARRRCGRL